MLKESMKKSALVKDKSQIPRGCQHVYSKIFFFKANKAFFMSYSFSYRSCKEEKHILIIQSLDKARLFQRYFRRNILQPYE